MKIAIHVRPALESDKAFVHSSWFQSYWKNHAIDKIPREVYNKHQDSLIDSLLARSYISVAYIPEVPDEILGWSVVEGHTLHWAYVKSLYRKNGIARMVIPVGLKYYSHSTNAPGRKFLERLGMQFNPYEATP